MSLIHKLNPEQKVLAKSRRELRQLDQEMTEKELEFATLQAKLASFQNRYDSQVGNLYTELDELEAGIAEFLFSLNPEDQEMKRRALTARAKANVSKQIYDNAEINQVEEFKPSRTLKDLFRKAAKLSHPDRCRNLEDKKYREQLMATINDTYKANDEIKLRSILRKLISNVHILEETDIEGQIADTCSQINQVKKRIEEISKNISELKDTEIYKLQQQVLEASFKGRDLLSEMALEVNKMLIQAKHEFDELKKQLNIDFIYKFSPVSEDI